MPFTYEYPRPELTADCVVFGADEDGLKLLLIERAKEPFKGRFALPGGFVDMDETTLQAARRELEEETGLKTNSLVQLHTFSAPDRDPRGRTVAVAHLALVRPSAVAAGDDAAKAEWVEVNALPPLAFDHDEIVAVALSRLQANVRCQPLGQELLPARFTIERLQRLYEIILGRALEERKFRRAILKTGVLSELQEFAKGSSRRPQRLYRFNKAEYERRLRQGFSLEI